MYFVFIRDFILDKTFGYLISLMAKEHLEIPNLRETEFTYSGFTGYGSTREILLVLGKECGLEYL